MPLVARPRALGGQGTKGDDFAKPPMRVSRRLGMRPSARMMAAMTLLEPVGKAPERSDLAGFVPRQAEDPVAHQLLRPLFNDDRETLVLAGFDAFERLVCIERVDSDSIGRCTIPPRCWRALLGGGIAAVLMAHNHPSGAAWPSEADIGVTQQAALFLRTMDIDLVDHLIFVADGHFSFRSAQMV